MQPKVSADPLLEQLACELKSFNQQKDDQREQCHSSGPLEFVEAFSRFDERQSENHFKKVNIYLDTESERPWQSDHNLLGKYHLKENL